MAHPQFRIDGKTSFCDKQISRFKMLLIMAAAAAVMIPSGMAVAQSSSSNVLPGGTTTLIAPIGPGDMLNVAVVGQPDLSIAYQVDGNGDITMLYVGKVHVGGLTPDQAATAVKSKLSSIYVDPEVTLTRAAMGGNTITVTGAVMHQGTQAARRDSTLNDIIQMATPQSDADLTKIQVTRGLPGQAHSTNTYDLASFLNSGDMKSNPTLADGDVIFIPSKAALTFKVSCEGAVAKPGAFYVNPGTTVVDLITQAGGLNPDADKDNLYIEPLGTTEHRTFDYTKATENPADPTLNPQLSDGDQIVASELQVKPLVTITGGVLRAGTYPIDGRMSLTDAVGAAGGLAPRAQVAHTVITRMDGKGGYTIINLDARDPQIAANYILQPGDNIMIPPGNPQKDWESNPLLGPFLWLFHL